MDVVVVGCKDLVPDSTRVLAEQKVAKLGRRTQVLERAEVRLLEDPRAPQAERRVCEVTVIGHGHTLRTRCRAHELAAAVDLAVDKLGHQVERLKGKLVGRSQPRRVRAVVRG